MRNILIKIYFIVMDTSISTDHNFMKNLKEIFMILGRGRR